VDQGEEETWDTVGGATERNRSPGPATETIVPEVAQQAADANESRASAEERRPEPSSTTRAEGHRGAHVEDEASTEAGIVDITSILGAPAVTIVRSRF
jgi:hypothetical protein